MWEMAEASLGMGGRWSTSYLNLQSYDSARPEISTTGLLQRGWEPCGIAFIGDEIIYVFKRKWTESV
jgi:hypothetical protein